VPDHRVEELAVRVSQIAPGAAAGALRDDLLARYDLAAAMRRITCPTLLVRGEWDRGGAIRDEDVAFVEANLPAAQVLLFRGTGHAPHVEQTDAVMEHIDTFLHAVLDAWRTTPRVSEEG